MGNLLPLLHLAGGTFPTGGFSQSWGLETYIYYDEIKDEEGFREFLEMYIYRVLRCFEGPFFSDAYDFVAAGEMTRLPELEEIFLAMRLTKETREMSFRTGKAFMRITSDILEDEDIKKYYGDQKEVGISFPIAFALVCARLKVDKRESLGAYFFNAVNGLVQSGLKSIPLGNAQAQRILLGTYEQIDSAVEYAAVTGAKDAFSFCPGLDIASMCHETLPTRLYMT